MNGLKRVPFKGGEQYSRGRGLQEKEFFWGVSSVFRCFLPT